MSTQPQGQEKTMGPFKTGLDWVYRSIMLLRQSPPKWLLYALLYVVLFILLPSIPGMPVLISLIVILFWPTLLALFIGVYREEDLGREAEPRKLVEQIRPNFVGLISLGGIFLAYGILTGYLVRDEMAAFAALVEQKADPQMLIDLAMPLMLKMLLLLSPMILASWFSPMLVAYHGYSVLDAIKHSLWQCLRNMVAITVSLTLAGAGITLLMLLAGVLVGLVTALSGVVGAVLMSLVVLLSLLIITYFLLAIQYYSYRHVYYRPDASVNEISSD